MSPPCPPAFAPPGTLLAVYAGAHGRPTGWTRYWTPPRCCATRRGRPRSCCLLVGEGARKPALVARASGANLPVRFLDPLPKPRLARLPGGAEVALHCLAPNPAFAAWSAPNKLVEGLGRRPPPLLTNVPGPAGG